MHIYAGRVIGLIDAILDNLNDDLTGVETYADLQARIMEPRDRVLHG